MTIRQANLIHSDAAEPAAGIQYTNIIQWYGGPITFDLHGAWDGASIDVVMCSTFPAGGTIVNSTQPPDADWVSLHTFTADGSYQLVNLNPCLLCTKVTSPGTNTRVKGVVS